MGGIDERAYHHLAAEIIDNAMDEAVAGYASVITVELLADGKISVSDNGRGIPVDPHPKYPDKSALEVITTMLHSGGKFGGKAYAVSGGLHGVGLSVVNALSSEMTVDVARDKKLWRQSYCRGVPLAPVEMVGAVSNRRGTTVTFLPDTEIFGTETHFKPATIFKAVKTKAFLFRGVELRFLCSPELIKEGDTTPTEVVLKYPNGIEDYLKSLTEKTSLLMPRYFTGKAELAEDKGHVEWAMVWPDFAPDAFQYSYCNTIPTPQGGTHETGLRAGLTKSLRAYAEMVGCKRAAEITADDIVGTADVMLSLFLKDPQFQGQTKEKLASPEAARLVENAVKDPFDHWLSADTKMANILLDYILERVEERKRKKKTPHRFGEFFDLVRDYLPWL